MSNGAPGKVRSGYARDVAPELLTAEEKAGMAVPPADDMGGQRGRIPPALRKGANYEAVDAAEAERRMIARRKGTMPPIPGGLDDHNMPETNPQQAPAPAKTPDQYDDDRMEANDSPDLDGVAAADAATAGIIASVLKALQQPPQAKPQQPRPRRSMPAVGLEVPPEGRQDYMSQRHRVTLEFKEGRYAIPVIDVKVTPAAVLLILPYDSNGATFTPNSGTDVGLTCGKDSWTCYFPGTAFEVPELKVVLLAFLRKEEASKTG
jgi:hypothetical protein